MKILFTGPFEGFSGFSVAARSMLKALNHQKADLVARTLQYDIADPGTEYKVEKWLDDLLVRPLQDIDMLIQCTTPNVEAVPKPGICNGIYTFIETDRIPSYWVNQLNQFNFVLVSSKYNAWAMGRSGVNVPILVLPVPFDSDRLKIEDDEPLIKAEGRTIFYNINQLSGKKGIDLLLRAYFSAFADKPDEVLLVLKTYINMANRANDHQIIKQFIDKIKQGCRLPIQKYPPIQLITRTMSESDIQRIHRDCDCYVNSSHTEGYGLPVFDALAHGNMVITNSYGGLAEFVGDQNALIYGGTESHCFDMNSPDPAHFTGMSRWFEPSTVQISDLMRLYYELKIGHERGVLDEHNQKQWESIEIRRANGITVTKSFDYREASGKIIHQIYAAYNTWKEFGIVKFANPAFSGIDEGGNLQ
jgi:glycosyltransferase involved in cell wall biosynthesis